MASADENLLADRAVPADVDAFLDLPAVHVGVREDANSRADIDPS